MYKADATGNVIDAGTGLPNGDLGVPPIVILESPTINAPSGVETPAILLGVSQNEINFANGERVRYHVAAEKVGTAGGNKTITIYYGSAHASFIQLPVPIEASDVGYNGTLSGLAATNVQQAIDELNSSSGSNKSFQNGLTEANNIVSLGGPLTADTIINLVTYFLELQSPANGPNQAKFRIDGGADGTIISQVNDQIATVINRVTLNGGAASQSSVVSGNLISRLTITPQGISMESQTLTLQDVKLYMDDEDILKLDVRPEAGQESIFTIREAAAGNAALQIKYTFDREGIPKLDTDVATKKYVDDNAGGGGGGSLIKTESSTTPGDFSYAINPNAGSARNSVNLNSSADAIYSLIQLF